jgi:predicted ATPase
MVMQPGGTVTLVFTDIEKSTRLLSELGRERYQRALAAHRETIRGACACHRGYEVDYEGDSFFYAFQSAGEAVSAVREAIAALASGPIRVRVGVHTGEPALDPPRYVGMDVHRAARIMACAHGGQVVLSQATRDLLGADVELRDLGEHRLKDLNAPIRLYQLGNEEFPPLRSLYRSNLPASATPFLGRERELAEVVALLYRPDVRLVTLIGPGGTGKTRLALAAAAEAADEFPDGLTWVALAPLRDPALLIAAVAKALGVKEQPGRPLADSLVVRLSAGRGLLLLDNAEHLLPEAAGDVARLREARSVVLLVTSRERLALQGEHVWSVPPLDDQDGVALFTARARALDATFTPSDAVAELCRRLDNLPLALELAAARTTLFSPEQLLERVGQRLDLLKAGRDADPRQQTLRTTIAWSHDLLNADERRLFSRLAVFVGGCTYDAAEKVCAADADTFQSLLDKSLLRRRDTELGSRYWMLETIREFGVELLQNSSELGELRERHADYFLTLAEETEPALHGSDQVAGLDRLDADHDNLRAALDSGPQERRLRLAAALSWFWQLRSYLTEGLDWLERALDEVSAPTVNRARALDGAGRLAFYRSDRRRDLQLLAEAGRLMRSLGDERGAAQSLAYLGIAAGVAGDAETTRTAGEDAVKASRASGDDWTRALALWGLGTNLVLGRCGAPDLEAGVPLLEESAALFRAAGDRWGLAGPLLYLSRSARVSGDLRAAQRLLGECVDLLRAIGDPFRLNLALQGLGDIARAQGDETTAQRFYWDALEACREIGRPAAIADAQLKLAYTAIARGETGEARPLLDQSLAGYRRDGDDGGILWVVEGFALLAARAGDRERAGILLGASETRPTGGGVRLDRDDRERLEATLRRELGDERFEAARARGSSTSPEEAVEHALSATLEP